MSNVIPLPTTPAGFRALREARGHRKTSVLWLLSQMSEDSSAYTQRCACAVLRAVRSGEQPPREAMRWLSVMCSTFDDRSRAAARCLREEFASRRNV